MRRVPRFWLRISFLSSLSILSVVAKNDALRGLRMCPEPGRERRMLLSVACFREHGTLSINWPCVQVFAPSIAQSMEQGASQELDSGALFKCQ